MLQHVGEPVGEPIETPRNQPAQPPVSTGFIDADGRAGRQAGGQHPGIHERLQRRAVPARLRSLPQRLWPAPAPQPKQPEPEEDAYDDTLVIGDQSREAIEETGERLLPHRQRDDVDTPLSIR